MNLVSPFRSGLRTTPSSRNGTSGTPSLAARRGKIRVLEAVGETVKRRRFHPAEQDAYAARLRPLDDAGQVLFDCGEGNPA
jgi:hypothetical protein